MPDTILLVEDETAIADTLLYALRREGFDTDWLALAAPALTRLQQQPYALVILDVGLPDQSGFELCKQIRYFSQVPIIFLTARDAEIDRIVGLEIGADDYVAKPFSPRELIARIRAILKRTRSNPPHQPSPATMLCYADFRWNKDGANIEYRGQLLDLTRYEYLILGVLLEAPKRVFNREQIMQRVWNDPAASLERSVDTHIKTLRAKLRAVHDSDPIRTHRGLGYSLEC